MNICIFKHVLCTVKFICSASRQRLRVCNGTLLHNFKFAVFAWLGHKARLTALTPSIQSPAPRMSKKALLGSLSDASSFSTTAVFWPLSPRRSASSLVIRTTFFPVPFACQAQQHENVDLVDANVIAAYLQVPGIHARAYAQLNIHAPNIYLLVSRNILMYPQK